MGWWHLYLYFIYQAQIQCICASDKLEERIRKLFLKKWHSLLTENLFFRNVVINPELTSGDSWREKANAWLNGANVNNQGKYDQLI